MLLGVGPFESLDCKLPAGVVKLGQRLTRGLLVELKQQHCGLKELSQIGTGLVVLLAGVGLEVLAYSAATLEVVHHNKHP
jgi:hypothetical protein